MIFFIIEMILTCLQSHLRMMLCSTDFADGKIKPILGFLWTLLRHFRVAVAAGSEGQSFEDALLAWVNEQVEDYEVPVADFVRSFTDGRALCALMHKYDSTFLDWDSVTPENKTGNCENAMGLAFSKIGIPQLMDPAKLASGDGDEKSMILYLSLIQQAFVRKFADAAANEEKTGIKSKLSEVQSQLSSVTSERDELLKLKSSLEEELTQMRDSADEWKKRCKELEEENESLRKALAESTKKCTYLEERLRVMEEIQKSDSGERADIDGQLTKLREELEKVKREKKEIEEERDEFKRERDALDREQRDMLDSMEAFKGARSKMEGEYDQRNKLGLLGLDTLRKNLLEHLKDMNTWKVYLEQDRQYQAETIQQTTESSIAKSSFEDQLTVLSTALTSENTKLQLLLKDREREEAEKKAAKEAEKTAKK
jgi:chromosome segregation ATPase